MTNIDYKTLLKRYEHERLIRRRAEQIVEEKNRELLEKERELERAIAGEEAARREIERLSIVDVLTGLNNRQYFDAVSAREFSLAVRHEKPLSAMMLDIDYFKWINDTYGHGVGDLVLIEIATACKEQTRSTDLCSRYGGGEICILLSETDAIGAEVAATRLLRAVSSLVFESQQCRFSVTVSIGVADRRGDEDSLPDILKRSEYALHKAKRSGRNKVVSWTEDLIREDEEKARADFAGSMMEIPGKHRYNSNPEKMLQIYMMRTGILEYRKRKNDR